MVFKKDLTPLSKRGSVVKHQGKGGADRRPDMMSRLTNAYPKAPAPAPLPTSAPPLGGPALGPPAAAPIGTGVEPPV